jgi:hypothetical protein
MMHPRGRPATLAPKSGAGSGRARPVPSGIGGTKLAAIRFPGSP